MQINLLKLNSEKVRELQTSDKKNPRNMIKPKDAILKSMIQVVSLTVQA